MCENGLQNGTLSMRRNESVASVNEPCKAKDVNGKERTRPHDQLYVCPLRKWKTYETRIRGDRTDEENIHFFFGLKYTIRRRRRRHHRAQQEQQQKSQNGQRIPYVYVSEFWDRRAH